MARLRSDADVDKLVGIYRRTQLRVSRLLRQAIASSATGTAEYRAQQLVAIQRELDKLERQAGPVLEAAMRGSYLDGATIASASLGSPLLAANAQGRFFGVHEPAMRAIAGEIDRRLALSRQTIGRQVDDVFARLGNEAIAQGVAGGLSRREVSRELVDDLVKAGQTAFVDRRGARWSLDTYAETVVRTATRQAVTLGTVNRTLELGHDLITISRHANSCPQCLPFEGRTYSITGQTEGYPRLEDAPPFHPRCRHVATPAAIFDPPAPEPEPDPDPPAPEDPVEPPGPAGAGADAGDGYRIGDEVRIKQGPAGEVGKTGRITGTEPSFDGQFPQGMKLVEIDGETYRLLPTDIEPVGLELASDLTTSDVFKVRLRGPNGDRVREHLEAIDQVHAMPATAERPDIVGFDSSRNAGGFKLSWDMASETLINPEIRVNRALLEIQNSTTHEIGHFLDALELGGEIRARGEIVRAASGRRKVKTTYPSEESPGYQAWREAIESSEGGRLMRSRGGDYFGSWLGLWARSYEQWIATRSGSPALARKIRRSGGRQEDVGRGTFSRYWEPEDFEEIAAAFDEIFEKAGLLRRRR